MTAHHITAGQHLRALGARRGRETCPAATHFTGQRLQDRGIFASGTYGRSRRETVADLTSVVTATFVHDGAFDPDADVAGAPSRSEVSTFFDRSQPRGAGPPGSSCAYRELGPCHATAMYSWRTARAASPTCRPPRWAASAPQRPSCPGDLHPGRGRSNRALRWLDVRASGGSKSSQPDPGTRRCPARRAAPCAGCLFPGRRYTVNAWGSDGGSGDRVSGTRRAFPTGSGHSISAKALVGSSPAGWSDGDTPKLLGW